MAEVAQQLKVMQGAQAEALDAYREEMEKQCTQFQSEIELLREKIREVEERREKTIKGKKKELEPKNGTRDKDIPAVKKNQAQLTS